MKIRYLNILFCAILLAACETENTAPPVEGSAVEVTAALNKQPQARSNFDGTAFTDGDQFTLYEGAPSSTANVSLYTYGSSVWSGTPGLYWDDLSIWNNDGTINTNDDVLFTAILTNGLDWNPTSPFNVLTVPTTEDEFLKSDLLVAYDARVPLQPLSLTFNHVMARLRIQITDNTAESDKPYILGDETELSLNNALINSTITFNPTLPTSTTVTATGSDKVTLMRTDNNSSRTFVYEIILPPQSLSTSVLTISNNDNEKEYTYNMNNATISGDTGADLLQQGYTTTISLNIEKTGVELGTVKVTNWDDLTSHGTATPNDYPIINIGGGDDGGDKPTPDPEDDYAGKTLRLTKDITLGELRDQIDIPLGSRETPFRGTFDGQGFSITDVELELNEDFVGIFGYTDGATIKNLNVKGSNVRNNSTNSGTATGGLVGYANNTLITNCHVSFSPDEETIGHVSAAYDNVGGLVGYAVGGTRIEYCSAKTMISAGHNYAGGLVGRALAGTSIRYSFGHQYDTTTDHYVVEAGNYYAGGLVGGCNNTDIEYCYSWSCASAARYVGGLVGRYESTGDATNLLRYSYAAGYKINGVNAAGIVGYIDMRSGTPDKCFWNNRIGIGFIGLYTNGDNSSFTLTTTQAAMNNVLNTLNDSSENGTEWELTRTLYTNYKYVFPTLLKNKGKAEPQTGE